MPTTVYNYIRNALLGLEHLNDHQNLFSLADTENIYDHVKMFYSLPSHANQRSRDTFTLGKAMEIKIISHVGRGRNGREWSEGGVGKGVG